MRHLRLGGKILTTVAWVLEFGQKLSDADAAYFDSGVGRHEPTPRPRVRRSRPSAPPSDTRRQADRAARDRELDAEGL
jgi:hypothetical protein